MRWWRWWSFFRGSLHSRRENSNHCNGKYESLQSHCVYALLGTCPNGTCRKIVPFGGIETFRSVTTTPLVIKTRNAQKRANACICSHTSLTSWMHSPRHIFEKRRSHLILFWRNLLCTESPWHSCQGSHFPEMTSELKPKVKICRRP